MPPSILCALAAFFLIVHLATLVIAFARCRPAGSPCARDPSLPPVTVVRPLCGVETFSRETLAASFALDYPSLELIFCVAGPNDAIVPMVREAIAAHPDVPARLLVGDDVISINPKLNNMVKGWREATHERLVFIDSQRAGAARLHTPAARDLARRHGRGLGAAGRRLARGVRRARRMRVPQHLRGPLAICGRHVRLRLRAGEDPVLPQVRSRQDRHARTRRRTGGGCGDDQDGAAPRPAHKARSAFAAAARGPALWPRSGGASSVGRACAARHS